jgi:AcrR family transcriptional regulator
MPAARRADELRPRKQPVQARSRDTVQVILRAAAQVFASTGYAASTNHIADRAGVSIGSLYEYFPNKDALLVALMEAHIREGEAILTQAALEVGAGKPEVREVVRLFAHAMVSLHARERALHRVLFEETPLPRRVRRMLTDLENQVIGSVEAFLRAHPEVTRRDPALAAAVIVHAVEGVTHRLVVHRDRDADIDPYVEEIVALVCGYIESAPD